MILCFLYFLSILLLVLVLAVYTKFYLTAIFFKSSLKGDTDFLNVSFLRDNFNSILSTNLCNFHIVVGGWFEFDLHLKNAYLFFYLFCHYFFFFFFFFFLTLDFTSRKFTIFIITLMVISCLQSS